TELDRARALDLGAPPERTRVAGNTKFEQEVACLAPERLASLREHLGLHTRAPLWIVGSSHPGEEEQVLAAYARAREQVPDLRLLIAPRHVERVDEVAAAVIVAGFPYRRRSEPGGEPDAVLLLDTMGELAALYALADVVFVGGSLV